MVETEKNTTEAPIGARSAVAAWEVDVMNMSMIKKTIITFFILIFPKLLFAAVSNDIPLESPIYNNINRLSNNGYIRDDIQSIRPMTVDRLQEISDQLPESSDLPNVIQRDIQTIRTFLLQQNRQNEIQTGTQFTALHTNAEPSPMLQTDALINPLLNRQDEGRFQSQSTAFRLQPRLAFNWEGWAAFEIQPSLALENSSIPGVDEDRIFLQTAQLKLGHNDLEFSIGRSRIQWGRGILGGLIFGGSQTPLDMIQLRNSSPIVLPSFLKYFGPTQFALFVAKLDENQVFPGSLIIGERAVIQPHRILELGFTQSIQLAGEGAPSLSFVDVVSEVIGKRLEDINSINLTNRNFSADGSIRLPFLSNTKIYAELFFEDCCEFPLTRDTSKLVGMMFPDLFKSSGTLSLEFVHTTEIYNRHGRYTSGFINRGSTLGHPLGPDAEAFYLQYQQALPQQMEVNLLGAYEIRANQQLQWRSTDIRTVVPSFEESEKRYRAMIKIQKTWKGSCWTSFQTGYERILNFAYIDDQTKNNYLLRIDHNFSF